MFGVIDFLNFVSSRWCCDIESMCNVSYIKFFINDIMFGVIGELLFFIWIWELSGLIIFMIDSKSNYISVSINEGVLVVYIILNG